MIAKNIYSTVLPYLLLKKTSFEKSKSYTPRPGIEPGSRT
jgi:hypothetical protein